MKYNFGDIVIIDEFDYKASQLLWRGGDHYKNPKKCVRYCIVIHVANNGNDLILLSLTTASLKKMWNEYKKILDEKNESEKNISYEELKTLSDKKEKTDELSIEEDLLFEEMKKLDKIINSLESKAIIAKNNFDNKISILNKKIKNKKILMLNDELVDLYETLDFPIQFVPTFACPIKADKIIRLIEPSNNNNKIQLQIDHLLSGMPNKFKKQLKYWKNYLQ